MVDLLGICDGTHATAERVNGRWCAAALFRNGVQAVTWAE